MRYWTLAPGEDLADEKRILLCGTLAVVLLAYAGIERVAPERIEDMARKPLSMAIIPAVLGFSALGIWGGNLGAPVLVAISASIIVILVVLDISRRIRNPLGRQRETN